MTKSSRAKIFLADKRGCNETDKYRSYNTLSLENNFKECKTPFNSLYLFNDETIAAGHSVKTVVRESSCIFLLPVVGILICRIDNGEETHVNPGELRSFYLQKNSVIELVNCYESGLINFIQFRIRANAVNNNYTNRLFSFDLNKNKNSLININASLNHKAKDVIVSIGKFTGRNEAVYTLQHQQNNLFAFVIEGVFEIQGRLLHARDGLALWNEPAEIESEALSNDAILLMIESPQIS